MSGIIKQTLFYLHEVLVIRTIFRKEPKHVLPIVPYKFYIMPLVAFFDAVNTDGVPICCITGVTSGEKGNK